MAEIFEGLLFVGLVIPRIALLSFAPTGLAFTSASGDALGHRFARSWGVSGGAVNRSRGGRFIACEAVRATTVRKISYTLMPPRYSTRLMALGL